MENSARPFLALVAAQHDRRRAFLQLVDADGEEAEHILVQAKLPLHLAQRGGLDIETEEQVMALPVLLDPVGQAAQTPVFALAHGGALGFHLGHHGVRHGVHLLLGDLTASYDDALV